MAACRFPPWSKGRINCGFALVYTLNPSQKDDKMGNFTMNNRSHFY